MFIFCGFGFVHGTLAPRLREALSYRVAPRVTALPLRFQPVTQADAQKRRAA